VTRPPSEEDSLTKPVIIFRLGSLGDTVIALPCFHLIARCFPQAERIALTNVPHSKEAVPLESILVNGGLIHNCVGYPLMTRNIAPLLELRRKLRATGADTLIYLQRRINLAYVYRDVLFFRACGFRRIVGAPLTRDANFGRVDPKTGEVEQEASRLARSMAPLGAIDLDDQAGWDLNLTVGERERADEVLRPLGGKPFVAVSVGGKLAIQDWGDENWSELMSRLAPKLAVPLVFVGGPEDSSRSLRLAEGWTAPALDACGRLTPRETAALLRRATFFVGHDSGPLHLAAASGLRCVSLFGSRDRPRIWHPVGRHHRTFHDVDGVKNIPPEQVASAVTAVAAEVLDGS
jgi:heptosyltransferase III